MGWMNDEKCRHCGKERCYTHCDSSEDGKHSPDWKSIALADMSDAINEKRVVFDVNCDHCGQSGSFTLDVKSEVHWD